jgi:hypothetical protein
MPRKQNNKQQEIDPLVPENFPEDIKDALNVIVGNRPKSFDEEFKPNPEAHPSFAGAAFGGTSSQKEFIKKKDPIEKGVKLTNNQIFLLDITKEKDLKKYEEILDLVFDPESGVQLAEPIKEPHYLLDPNSTDGYKALLIIKITKPVEYIKKTGTGYTVVEKKSDKT